MPSFLSPKAITYGWLAGWATIAVLVLYFGVNVIAGATQIQLPSHFLDPAFSLLNSVLFFVFMYGLYALAVGRSDSDLAGAFRSITIVFVFTCVLNLLSSFDRYLTEEFILIFLVALVPLLCVSGIFFLRAGDALLKHEATYGQVARRAAWWSKVSGWMLASVVLIPIGIFALVVAEFFLWRLLAKARKPAVVS